jgi:hypothetical protein
MIHRLITTAAVITGLALCSAHADPYAKGSKVAAFSAKTQHDKDFTLKPADTRFLLVSHDMETGKKANAVLTTVGPDNLTKKKVVYLANIYGMPGVGRMFALPKMRKYSHTIILGDDAELIAKFPEEKNKVTVLKLSGGKVTSVKYWDPGAEGVDNFLK